MVEFNYRCHLDAVMKLMDANVLKYASWSLGEWARLAHVASVE